MTPILDLMRRDLRLAWRRRTPLLVPMLGTGVLLLLTFAQMKQGAAGGLGALALVLFASAVGPMFSTGLRAWTDEREQGTLDELLLRPLTVPQLIAAKTGTAIVIGAVTMTLALALVVTLAILRPRIVGAAALLDPRIVAVVLLLTPLAAVPAALFGVVLGGRVRDPQAAALVGSVVMLPLYAVVFGVYAGLASVSLQGLVLATVLLVAIASIGARAMFRSVSIDHLVAPPAT